MRRLLIFFALLALSLPALGAGHSHGDTISLIDEVGEIVTLATISLSPGDVYIAADNRQYEVVGIEGNEVRVRYTETIDLTPYKPRPKQASLIQRLTGWMGQGNSEENPLIGIYHTHSSESYLPGEAFTDVGDIYDVGSAFASSLEQQGFRVIQSQENHNPHDGGAYDRSRTTAFDLLKEGPVTLFDVHRDGVEDPDFYRTTVRGENMTKVRLVTGRQNQNNQTNFEYAKALKAAADEVLPGIIEGIFWARGNYNQDLGPRVILLEFGTHTTTKEEAVRSAEFFAEAVAAAIPPGQAQAGTAGERGGVGRSILWILGIAGAGILGFLLINSGSLKGVKEQFGSFFNKEFSHSLAPKDEEKDQNQEENDADPKP